MRGVALFYILTRMEWAIIDDEDEVLRQEDGVKNGSCDGVE